MWLALEKLIHLGGKFVNSPIMGAFFGVILGMLPLALLTSSISFGTAIWIAGCVGALVGYFYHRGYRDAETTGANDIASSRRWSMR